MKCIAQKARREVEAKTKKEAERRRITKDIAFLESAERSQAMGSKYKKVASVDKEEYWPLKKAEGKYRRDDAIIILNP